MSASYPSSPKTFTSRSAGQPIGSAHMNDVQDEINAIETDLIAGKVAGVGVARLTAQTFTGAQQFPAGTNALPSVAVNDTDVGMYSSGTNALDFATNGLKALGIDSTQFVDSPTQPRCGVYHNTTQSLTTATDTALLMNSEDFDVATMHDTVTNNSRATVPTGGDGLYMIVGQGCPQGAIATEFRVTIKKNGATVLGTTRVNLPASGGTQCIQVAVIAVLAATDYVEVFGYQATGGALLFGDAAARQFQNQLQVVKLW